MDCCVDGYESCATYCMRNITICNTPQPFRQKEGHGTKTKKQPFTLYN